MKCPNCGNELEEGHLICEVCGEEIQMVPDFEPEIENKIESSITETLSTLAALQEDGQPSGGGEGNSGHELTDSVNDKGRHDDAARGGQSSAAKKARRNSRIWIAAVTAALLVLAAVAYGLYAGYVRSVDYRMEKARTYAADGDYAQAVACLEDLYRDHPELSKVLFMEADYYYLQNDNVSAVQALTRVIDKGDYPDADLQEAYGKIVTIYANQGEYGKINELLLACQKPEIREQFLDYMALPPEFSYVEGSYDGMIPLKLSANTSGTIYYTTDGSRPTMGSPVYMAPLFLEAGEHTVSAFFVNDYGIESDIVSKTYTVNIPAPNPPEIALYSGEYTEPAMIEVEEAAGCSVYYTTDGSNPTEASVPYTGPIPLPLGRSVFKFVNISEDGVSSEVTDRVYTLRLTNAISASEAVDALTARLVETGYLQDGEGHGGQGDGIFSYRVSSAIRIGAADDYYTVYEYYAAGTEAPVQTDKVFLVNLHTGETAQLTYDENGGFVAAAL